ncbi:MAG: hypothetical protein ACI9XO_001607 [Paraglaciecola sp.]|jgi:hypothetical protein
MVNMAQFPLFVFIAKLLLGKSQIALTHIRKGQKIPGFFLFVAILP